MPLLSPADSFPALSPTPPGGQVVVSAYCSGAIGRLVPDDMIGLVRYLRENATA
jgi:hypothetical protein